MNHIIKMETIRTRIAILLSGALLSSFSLFAGSVWDWKSINVEVKANQPVVTAQKTERIANGFQQLTILLSNNGKQPLTIDKISITIPLNDKLTNNLEILYGSSCMGRTPLLRQTIGAKTNISSSHMYEMIRLADGKYMFAGSVSWRIFMPNFTLKDGSLFVWSEGEGKQLKPGQTIEYEQIVFNIADDWVGILNQFGSAIAVENKISKVKNVDFKGWATWDYYGFNFSTEQLKANLNEIKKLYPASNLFQIDAGWSTARGDNTTVKENFPGGLKAIADMSKAQGMQPGIWIDGFRADTKSEIFKQHPEYFLRNQDDKVIIETVKKTNEDWNLVFFDYSHPDARAYMAECIRVIKEKWGIPYFKIDFMRYGLNQQIKNQNPSVKQIKAYDDTITDLERMRLGLKMMRDAIGPDNYLLGCSAVFAPCIGFVDGMRTAGDINPNYVAFSERVLGNAGNFYLNKVFNLDSDYLVFRAAADEDVSVSKEKKKFNGSLTLNESKMWADFCSLYSNCRLSSDNLVALRPERKALLKAVISYPVMDEIIPLDMWQHAQNKLDGFELLLSRKGKEVYLGIFNWEDNPKEYELKAFGKENPVRLEGRNSLILKYEGKESFNRLCQNLKSN